MEFKSLILEIKNNLLIYNKISNSQNYMINIYIIKTKVLIDWIY